MPRTPVDESLLLLVQRRPSPEREARLRALLDQSPDWSGLLRQATAHSVLPLVTRGLQDLGFPGVPPAVRAEFQHLAFLSAGRNLGLARELCEALRQLTAAGIPAIPLKGVALSSALYGTCTLRVSRDLDVLVRRAQVHDAVAALEALGYRAEGPWRRWAAARYHIEIPLSPRTAERRDPVDLHWGIIGGDPRNEGAAEDLWEAAGPATVLGVEAFALTPEWQLVFLALHAASHQWQGLKWLVDVQEIWQSWPLDWERMWAIARKWGWEEMLRLTIGACQSLWELPPAPGAGTVSWPSWLRQFPDPPREGWWARLRVMYLLFPRWPLRIGYLVRVVVTAGPNDYRWLPLPAALTPLYLFLRPLRWLLTYGRRSFRCALGRLGMSKPA